MDQRHSDLDGWRQARLGDEPIYCAAPSPSDPDDIICPGSDDELDHATRLAKRLRYEEQGLRYLRGKPLRIHSASLRGPFERSAGWQNPWLPKPPTKLLRSDPPPSHSVIRPEVIRQPTLKDIARLSGEEDGATPGADNSMICHLPSPQSNRDLDLRNGPLDTEKRVRIQAWASDLTSPLEKDGFWAPTQGFDQQIREHSRKRPAGKEWLKTKSSKRARPDNSQNTAAASTPTPTVTAHLSRSASAPPNRVQRQKSMVAAKNASQSFELATPSSSVDHKQRDCLQDEELDDSTGCHALVSGGNFPDSNLAGRSNTSSPVIAESPSLDIEAQQHNAEPSHAEHISEGSAKQHTANFTDETEHAAIGNVSFESCLDDSFHYRARPSKQYTPPPAVSNVTDTDLPSESAQNGVPASSNHKDAAPISPPPPSEGPIHSEAPESEYQENASSNISLCKSEQPEPTSNAAERQSTVAESVLIEAPVEPINYVDPMQSTTAKDNTISIATEHVSTNIDLTIAQSCTYAPSALLESRIDRERSVKVEECSESSEPLVDEGSTLVKDPMDIDKCPAEEISKAFGIGSALQSPSLVAVQSRLAADISNSEGSQACDQISEDGSAMASDSVVVPLSQMEWGVVEANSASPLKPAATCVTLETAAKAPSIKVEDVEADIGESAQPKPEPTPPIEEQNPWVSDDLLDTHPDVQHIKSEPIEDTPLPSLLPAHDNFCSPQAVICESPAVRPSQQSPWSGEMLGPVLMGMPSRVGNVIEETLSEHSRPQSPWTETNMITMSPPRSSLQPTSSALDSGPNPTSQADLAPSTPSAPEIRSSTPEPCISIKSFANFNTPSPQRRTSRPMLQSSSTSQRRGILVSGTPSNPWSSARSSRRVSFAPLPNGDGDGDDADVNTSPSASNITRAASPPPQTIPDLDNVGIDMDGDKFQNHFDTVKRRVSGEDAPRHQFQWRLLPSASQQKPMSPAIGAMAAAFRAADTARLALGDVDGRNDDDDKENNRGFYLDKDKDKEKDTSSNEVQSPWRHQDESQGMTGAVIEEDDVADVIRNLDEFLYS